MTSETIEITPEDIFGLIALSGEEFVPMNLSYPYNKGETT